MQKSNDPEEWWDAPCFDQRHELENCPFCELKKFSRDPPKIWYIVQINWGPKIRHNVVIISFHNSKEEAEKVKPENWEDIDGKWSEYTKYCVIALGEEIPVGEITGCC